MAKTQISIKLDSDLLARIDRLVESSGRNRTAVIEEAINNDLPEQEAFERSMEVPVVRAIHKQLTKPGMLRAIAALVDKPLTDEQVSAILEAAPRQREAGKKRQEERKGKKTLEGLEGA